MNKVEKKAVKRIHNLLDTLVIKEPFNAEEFKQIKNQIESFE